MPYSRGVLLGNFFEDSFIGKPVPKRIWHEHASHTHRVHDGRQLGGDKGVRAEDKVDGSLPWDLMFGHCGDEKKISNFSKRRLGTTREQAESEISSSFVAGSFGFPPVASRPRCSADVTWILSSNSRVLNLRK